MEVTKPLVKKEFPGGLYAALTIKMGDFHKWQWLGEWVHTNSKYAPNSVDDENIMCGLLEESLNHVYSLHSVQPERFEDQLDLLFPVKLR